MKNVVLLGSTGSIGTSTIKVAEDLPDRVRLVGLAAGGNTELLAKQTLKHRPEAVSLLDPAKAREMCILLSDFLRKTLGLGERESISWREELQLAQTYLDVEQVRFGARLRVEMNVDDVCADCLVPPLVLQPLIENAVKHGIATLVEGGTIRVESHVNGGLLAVSVENGFDPESPAPRRHGLGLRNVRSRLETRFGDAARLTSRSENNHFRAEIVVPCRRE